VSELMSLVWSYRGYLTYVNDRAGSGEPGGVGWKWVPKMMVHRYLRLTPLYCFIVLFYLEVMRSVT
jgi:hypothetical protein